MPTESTNLLDRLRAGAPVLRLSDAPNQNVPPEWIRVDEIIARIDALEGALAECAFLLVVSRPKLAKKYLAIADAGRPEVRDWQEHEPSYKRRPHE
jgi:hypothetical protein